MFSFRMSISKNKTLFPPLRLISSSALCYKSHYDVLEITPSATQGDVKAAYYEKSMKYHPDKNKGCEEAVQKFRDITEAYEVLGNVRLRKLYDKGILHRAEPQYTAEKHEMQHGTEKFYASREQRSKPPSPTGRTTIYDFDAWTNEHYGKAFARRETAKARYERKIKIIGHTKSETGGEIIIFSTIIMVFIITLLAYTNVNTYDVPKAINEDGKSETAENVDKG